MPDKPTKKHLHILGGISGICVGVFVLSFAFIATSHELAFVKDLGSPESVDRWLQNLYANYELFVLAIIFLILGFGSIFISAFSVFNILGENDWRKYLSISGYIIGIPFAISNFTSFLSKGIQLKTMREADLDLGSSIYAVVLFELRESNITATVTGPLFVVVLGTAFMAWAAKRAEFLPAWLCYWGMACGVMAVLYHFRVWLPFLSITGLGAGPLHMLWFFVAGIVLLVKARKIVLNDETIGDQKNLE